MVEWHHQLNGHKFESALGVGDGQGSLACCSPWGCEESDTTERPCNGGGGTAGDSSLTWVGGLWMETEEKLAEAK